MRVLAAFSALILASGAALAQDAPAPTAKPAAAKSAPKPKAAAPATTGKAEADLPASKQSIKDSYSAITLAERMSLQSDLVWTGDYNGLVNGEYSERLVAAVKAFQKRNKTKETGVLNLQERAALAEVAKPKKDEVGWKLLEDSATGARLGLPGKLVPQTSQGKSGTRWASADRKSTRLNSSHIPLSRMPSSA